MLCRSFTYHVQFRKYRCTQLSPSVLITLYNKNIVFCCVHMYFILLFYFRHNGMFSIKIKTFIFYSGDMGQLGFYNITFYLRIKKKQIFPSFQSKAETNCVFSSPEVSTKGKLFLDEQVIQDTEAELFSIDVFVRKLITYLRKNVWKSGRNILDCFYSNVVSEACFEGKHQSQ